MPVSIPNVSDIIKLVKAGMTVEAQEKIMELRQALMDAQEENLTLRGKVQSLETQLATVNKPVFPPCPKCGQRAYAVKESAPDPMFGDLGGVRRVQRCGACGFEESTLLTPQ